MYYENVQILIDVKVLKHIKQFIIHDQGDFYFMYDYISESNLAYFFNFGFEMSISEQKKRQTRD